MVVLEVDLDGPGELSLRFCFFLRILGSEVLVADGGVFVACWGSRESFRYFVGVRGVGDCDDCRGDGGGGVLLSEFDDGVEG